jgi:hypothetical protein
LAASTALIDCDLIAPPSCSARIKVLICLPNRLRKLSKITDYIVFNS